MRVVIFGYQEIGYQCLKVLLDQGEEIVGVVTHEDDPNEEIWFRSVAELARSRHRPVYTPQNPNEPGFVRLMRELAPDLILSFYYRRLLCPELLRIAPRGAMNLHGSLLPRYRGRCPANWVLIHGERETGVTLHHMIEEADAGDIVGQRRVPIEARDTIRSLNDKLATAAVGLVKETYPIIKAGAAPRVPQDFRLATIFRGRRPEDGEVSWENSAMSIYNLVRAVTHPYPGAFTRYQGKKLYLWEAALDGELVPGSSAGTIRHVDPSRGVSVGTGAGSLLLTRLQPEGGREMAAALFAEAAGLGAGERLGG